MQTQGRDDRDEDAVLSASVAARSEDFDALETRPVSARDAAFDLLRAVALVRIVLWHLFAQNWMTWIAAVPVMFFIAGSMLGRPGDHFRFLYRRLRRILLPLWVYAAAVALTCVWTGNLPGLSGRGVARALTWIVPVADPTSTGWDGGWLSTHLWYLRAYVWMLVLAPVLVRLAKRVGRTAVGVGICLVGFEAAARFHVPVIGSGATRVVLADAVVYGFFAVLGLWYRAASHKPSPRVLVIGSVVSALGAVGFAATAGLPSEGVNGSYPAILLVGCAWLALIGAGERWVRSIAERSKIRRVSHRVSSRSLSVYLWHPACIVVARRFVQVDGVIGSGLLIVVTAVLVLAAVAAVGWVEHVASSRSQTGRRLNRRSLFRTGLASVAIAGVALPLVGFHATAISAAGTGTQGGNALAATFVVGIPAPSAREALSDSAFATSSTPAAAPVAAVTAITAGGPLTTTAPQRETAAIGTGDNQPFAFETGRPVEASDTEAAPVASTTSTAVDARTAPPMLALVSSAAGPSTVPPTKPNPNAVAAGGLKTVRRWAKTTATTAVPKSRTRSKAPTVSSVVAGTRSGASKTAPSTIGSKPGKATVPTTVPSTVVAATPSSDRSPATSTSTTSTPGTPTSSIVTAAAPTTTRATAATPSTKLVVPPVEPLADTPVRLNDADLQRALDSWRATATPRPKTMVLALKSGTQTWVAKSPDGGVAFQEPDAVFGIASLTKTFTAALVLREVEKGTISLDTPAPVVKGLEVPVPGGVTVRRLLTHTAGLAEYNEAPGYKAWEPMTAVKAVNLSFAAPQKDGLGLTVRYANSNYLYLGLLLEQVTGKSYRDLVAGLVADAGLQHTTVDMTPQNGWVGFSSGGIASTLADLASWGQSLYTPGEILSARSVSLMTTLGDMNLGLGAWPVCPCWTDGAGVKRYTAIGHNTATGGMFYFPATGVTLVVMFEGATNDMVSLMNALAKAM